jgi:hypothetical protein
MNSLLNKESILEKIAEIEEQIKTILPKLNGNDCLRVAHSILEAFDNEFNDVQRQMFFFDRSNDQQIIAAYRNSLLHSIIVIKAINYLLYNLKNQKSTLSETPSIDIRLIISEDLDFPSDEEVLKQKHQVGTDECISNDVEMLGGSHTARRYYIFRNFYQIVGREQIFLTMIFLQKFWSLLSFQNMLHKNITIEISDTGKMVPIDLSPKKILEVDGFHARKLSFEHNRFPSWRLEIRKINELTLASSSRNRTSSLNRDIMFNGLKVELDEFNNLENFPNLFLQKHGVMFSIYSAIIQQMVSIAYSSKMTCAYLPKSRLIAKIIKNLDLKRSDVERVINSLIWQPGYSITEKPIITNGIQCLYSWVTVANGLFGPIYQYYDTLIDNDLKGKLFENECRKIFSIKKSDYVFNNRLIINRPILPQEISMKLWGYLKKRTDVDVIAVKNNILFIVECKSKKKPSSRKFRVENLFEKYYEELLYKTNWIVKNFEQFKQIAISQKYVIPNECKFVMPLLVSNLLIVNNQNFLVNNLTELECILSKTINPITPTCEFQLDSGVKISLPIFEITN